MTTPEDTAKKIEQAIAARSDADQARDEKLDKILDALDGVTKRVDAMEAAATKRDDKKRSDDEDDDDKRKRADDEIGRKSQSTIDQERAELTAAQLRADSVSTQFGRMAPRPMDGEKPLAYRIRLLREYQHNSPEFKDVDLKTITEGTTFDAIESRIYADSMKAAATPNVPTGFLHEVKTRDQSGREISKFYGEPRAWMQQFMQEPQLVVGFNKDFG